MMGNQKRWSGEQAAHGCVPAAGRMGMVEETQDRARHGEHRDEPPAESPAPAPGAPGRAAAVPRWLIVTQVGVILAVSAVIVLAIVVLRSSQPQVTHLRAEP